MQPLLLGDTADDRLHLRERRFGILDASRMDREREALRLDEDPRIEHRAQTPLGRQDRAARLLRLREDPQRASDPLLDAVEADETHAADRELLGQERDRSTGYDRDELATLRELLERVRRALHRARIGRIGDDLRERAVEVAEDRGDRRRFRERGQQVTHPWRG